MLSSIGVHIEGIAAPGRPFGRLFIHGGLSDGVATIEGATAEVIARAVIAWPNASAIGLDPLTGAITSGALAVQFNATAALCSIFARQVKARRVDVVLQADASASDTTMVLGGGTVNEGDLLYIDDELIYVVTFVSGSTWDVERAYAGTLQTAHKAGANMYRAPPYWVGRAITLYSLTLSDQYQEVTTASVLWRGYLTEPPDVTRAVTTLSLRAEDALASLRRAEVNRSPLQHAPDRALIPFASARGPAVVGQLIPSTSVTGDTTVHRRFVEWTAEGAWKAMQAGQSVLLTRLDVIQAPGVALLGSAPLEVGVEVKGPFVELALWSRALDEWILDNFGEQGVSPTIRCEHPYHPLTIAAALLFSESVFSDEDALAFNVMHPSMTLGVGFLGVISQWDALIRSTAHIEVDEFALCWDASPVKVYEVITQQLLPAYGFALSGDAAGLLRPIQLGLADVGQYASAPAVTPISEATWEWALSAGGALDAIKATLGGRPWRAGRRVEISAQGVRDPQDGSRATRMAKRAVARVEYPTIAAESAESYGAARLANALAWRYDGLPVVSCVLQADQAWFVGQFVRVLKPAGLVSPILFDADGARVDDLWDTATLIGQIVKLRPDVSRRRYEVDLLLTNYSYGAAARWRAPAARIKSRPGTAQYIVEGLSSDFGEAVSDALSLTVGDDVVLMSSALGYKGGSTSRSLLSIVASGADWLLTFSADFGVAGVAGDWLYLGTSAQYSNAGVIAGIDYPWVNMTDAATLPRPGSTFTDADEYS